MERYRVNHVTFRPTQGRDRIDLSGGVLTIHPGLPVVVEGLPLENGVDPNGLWDQAQRHNQWPEKKSLYLTRPNGQYLAAHGLVEI